MILSKSQLNFSVLLHNSSVLITTGRASQPIQCHLVTCPQEAANGIGPLDLIVLFDTEIHFS